MRTSREGSFSSAVVKNRHEKAGPVGDVDVCADAAVANVPVAAMTADISSALSMETSLYLLWLPRFYRAAATKPREETTLSDRHDEQPRKPQQHLAVVAGRIGIAEVRGVVGEKSLARLAIERVVERPQRRSLEPLHDPFGPRHHVIVDDVPNVEMAAQRTK